MKLVKGMYGHEFGARDAGVLFGFHAGQMRAHDFVHNGGWYNGLGEKLGWGDLDPSDFLKIKNGIDKGEVFIILPERASFWNFVTDNPGPIGACARTQPTAEAPGIDYVIEHAMYMIDCRNVFVVSDYRTGEVGSIGMRGSDTKVVAHFISRETVRQILDVIGEV